MSWSPPEVEAEAPSAATWSPPEIKGWSPPEVVPLAAYSDAIDDSRATMDQAWQRAGNAMAASNEREAATAAANQQRYRDEFGGPRATGVTPAGTANTAFLETVAKDPVGFVKAIPEIAMGAVAAPGKLAYNAAADVVSAVANQPEYGGNLASMMTGADRTPAETFIGSAAKDAPKLAVAANVAKALPELASMMAVNPSGAAGRLLALGFSADMIYHAKPLFDEYAAEKNLAEPNPGRLAELEAGIIQTFAFAPLAGAHGVGGSLNAGRLAIQDRVGRPDMNAVDTAAREAFNPAQAQQRGTLTTENPYLVKTEIGKQKSEMPEPGARELDYGQGGEMPRQSSEFRGPRPEPQIISAPQAAAKNVPGAAEPIAAAPEQSISPVVDKPAVAAQSKPAGAETITGSNVRQGTEMPAESGAIPGPTPASRQKTTYTNQRGHDLIDEIEANVGKISWKLIKEANPNWKPVGAARKIFAATGRPADTAAQEMHRSGHYKGDPGQVDQFGDAINAAALGRKGDRSKAGRETKTLLEEGRQAEQFGRRVLQGERPKAERANVETAQMQDLVEGDTFQVQQHKFTVEKMEFDPDGALTYAKVKDGPKFGVQELHGNELIHFDKGTLETKGQAVEWLPPEEKGVKNVSNPVVDNGGNSGKPPNRDAGLVDTGDVKNVGVGFVPQKFEIKKPIKGPTGAMIVGYEWRSKMGEKWSNREGGYVEARVSDWDQSDKSTGTGREIVHVFYVEHPGGNITIEGVRSAQNVLGINETRLMTIAKNERAAQAYREGQEKAEAAIWEKAAKPTAAEAARDYRQRNHSAMRSFEENNQMFNESVLFEKDGKFVRRPPNAKDFMERQGWSLVENDPAKPAVPKLRSGEKGTGDLLQGSDAPFNLAGEKASDGERIAKAKADALATSKAAAEFAAKNQQDMFGSPGGSGHGSTAYPPLNFPKLAGGVDAIRPMETPEILRLAVEMSGDVPSLKKLKRYMGYARAGKITMDYETFRDPQRLAMTLAHELGHVNDWFPDGTMKRGNVIGRLIGSVNQFLKGSFGNLNNKELRAELVDLSAYWHPWDRTASPDHYRKYRDSAVELYAEAVSVLLNSPGLLEQKAPKFYKAFFEHLDKKPKFRDEFFALQDLLARGPEAVLGERSKQSREQFMSGAEVLHEKIAFREAARNSFKDFLTKVRIQSLDIADFVKRRLGSKDPRQASEFDRLYEESRFEDNRNTADVQRIYHEMVLPIIKTGLDVHEFGQVLELQRIIGGLDAYKDMQAMRQTLGPDKMNVLKKASDAMANLERQGLADELGGNVIGDLDRAGIPGDLIDTYRQLNEAQGTRAELANPQGRSPILAESELNHLLSTVTPEQRAELLNSSARFRQLVFERATEARDVGIINKLTYDATIVPNKENYAAFRPLDKIEPFVSPMVRKARGTLKDIENPFITTLLKLQSLNNLIETQRVKNLVRDEMSRLHPADFKPAETRWSGRRMEAVPAKPGTGRVGILENGRLVQYDTDPYISKMFERLTPTDSFWLNKILEVPFRMGIYPLIIKYNPGFLFAFNPRRDMARTIRNLYAVEGVTRRELLPNYASPEVLKAVNDYLAGRPNPLAEAMIKNKAITTSWQGFSRIDQQDVMTDLLRRYKLAGEPHKSAAMRTLMWLPEKINQGGAFLEALPKFASYKTLIERGVGPERAAFLVRNYAGTPNFKIKGEFANVQNSYVPFINIFTQGWRSDLKIATNPKTAGGWWMQWALQHGWQAVVVGMATAGVFGDDIKKLYEGISEYDKTNYGTLPLGSQIGAGEFGNKTVYLRFPRDETSRLFSAMTYKTTRAIADQVMKNPGQPQGLPTELFAFGAGVIPSPSPVLNVAGAWKDYLAGRNPIDPFRNKPVIGQREFKAGGAPAVGDMVTWTLNQSGALNLVRWNPQSETTTELAVSGTPVINRLVKISDQGYREAQMNSETLDAKAKAQLRVQYNDAATALVAQHAWLQSLGAEKRTPEQNERYARLHAWKTGFYDRADEAAWNTRKDKGQQRAIIQQINTEADRLKKTIEPTARFTYGSTNTLLRALSPR